MATRPPRRLRDQRLTLAEAAVVFGLDRSTLYRWARAGDLTPIDSLPSSGSRGRVNLYLLADLAAVVATKRGARTDTP